MKPLVVIPARGGSKGLPGKNIKLLNGKPLINYTLEAARKVFDDEIICVSTDSEDIKKIVEKTGLYVPFIRPPELATDTMGTYDVLLHALTYYETQGYKADVLVLLQPTSPLRTSNHIKEAMSHYDPSCEMLVSVTETRANPYYVLKEEDENGWLVPSKIGTFSRRQDCPKVWEMNGAIYIINTVALVKGPLSQMTKVCKYEMDQTSSVDIDNELDWRLAEMIITKHLF